MDAISALCGPEINKANSWSWDKIWTTASETTSSTKPINGLRIIGLQDPRAGLTAVDLDVQAFDASPPRSFQRGLFRAADKIVEGRKIAGVSRQAKLYEVQNIAR